MSHQSDRHSGYRLILHSSAPRSDDLRACLLLGDLLGFRLLLCQEAYEEAVRIAAHDQTGCNSGLAIGDDSITADLLDLSLVCSEDIVLAFQALVQRKEDNGLSITIDLASGLLDVWDLGVKRRERVVTKRVGFLDIWRDIFVWLAEVWENGLGDLGVGVLGEGEGLGAVRVAFKS
jgi:hypothetical protein